MSNYVSPSLQWVNMATAPMQKWFTPTFEGWEHVPDHSRLLFVGNHTLFGLLDAPLLGAEIYRRKGWMVRGLGDRMHFRIPGWGALLRRHGVVEGTPDNCALLMQSNQPILVFPGGGREVCKRKGEAYQLIWKARRGFAKLAAEHNYSIVPVAALGADECYDILWDANDWQKILPSRLLNSKLYQNTLRQGEVIFPIAAGFKGSPLPKPIPFRFAFCPAIDTRQVDANDPRQVWQLREQVRFVLAKTLAQLKAASHQPPT